MKIVVTDDNTVVGNGVTLDFLQEFGDVEIYHDTAPEELDERIADADIVLVNKVVMTAPVIRRAPKLRFIGLFATGYNNVDLDAARERGIPVCNVPGYSTEAVAQHTFGLLLELTNQIGGYDRSVAAGDWINSQAFSYYTLALTELSGKSFGIVGYGAIGHRVAQIARAFGMEVLAYGRHPITDPTVTYLPLEDLLRQADVVSLHCPLNAESDTMMNEAAFAAMKPGALFINTARGALVDERALRAALESGHLGGAAVDVLRQEPMRADCPLYGAPRCVITPHIAWAGVETRRRLVLMVRDNIRAFLRGETVNDVTGG